MYIVTDSEVQSRTCSARLLWAHWTVHRYDHLWPYTLYTDRTEYSCPHNINMQTHTCTHTLTVYITVSGVLGLQQQFEPKQITLCRRNPATIPQHQIPWNYMGKLCAHNMLSYHTEGACEYKFWKDWGTTCSSMAVCSLRVLRATNHFAFTYSFMIANTTQTGQVTTYSNVS